MDDQRGTAAGIEDKIKMSKLLDEARQIDTDRTTVIKIPLDAEAAIAWANGEVGLTQLSKALLNGKNLNAQAVYRWLSLSLRLAVQEKRLVKNTER